MNSQNEQAIRQLFEVYSLAFYQSDLDAKTIRVSEGYAGTNFEPRKLDADEFQMWLLREWRTPLLKASWLNTFLTKDAVVLDEIPTNLRDRIVAEMSIEPRYRLAS